MSRFFLYKCGRSEAEHRQSLGDWQSYVFTDANIKAAKAVGWGVRGKHKGIEELSPGDLVIAQTSEGPRWIEGVARVVRFSRGGRVYLQPLEKIRTKLKPIKEADPEIARIPALQGGIIASVYPLDTDDAHRLLAAARAAAEIVGIGDAQSDPLHYEQVLRRVRAHQSVFRTNLLAAYGSRCAVAGTDVVEVLEAAHIDPHTLSGDNRTDNGLLLRADLHTLFDLDRLCVHPDTLEIVLAPSARTSQYAELHGRTLRGRVDGKRPDRDALARRWAKALAQPSWSVGEPVRR